MKKQEINKISSENYGSLMRPELASGLSFFGIPNPKSRSRGFGIGIFYFFSPEFSKNSRDLCKIPGIFIPGFRIFDLRDRVFFRGMGYSDKKPPLS